MNRPAGAPAHAMIGASHTSQHAAMTTIDEMLHLDLLTPHQHELISAWIARVKTPDAILQMPLHLWQALEQASERMNLDADLRQAPSYAA